MNTPTRIDALKTSDSILRRFKKVQDHGSPYRGRVHSVYRHTINLQFPDALLALQCADSPLSPISLSLPLNGSQMDALSVTQNAPCFVYPDHIEIHCKDSLILIHVENATAHYSASISDVAIGSTFRDCIGKVIQESGKSGFAYIFNDDPHLKGDFILQGARKCIQETEEFLKNEEPEKAAISLGRILGLGTGLTPSGDDFLCGVLAMLQTTGQDKIPFTRMLHRRIQQNLFATNDISGEFLQSALRGEYSEPAIHLLQAADRGIGEITGYAKSFLHIGHSSGIDTLCGMLWVLDNFTR